MDIEELFQEDLEEKNKFKAIIPESSNEATIFDYFEQKKEQKVVTKA